MAAVGVNLLMTNVTPLAARVEVTTAVSSALRSSDGGPRYEFAIDQLIVIFAMALEAEAVLPATVVVAAMTRPLGKRSPLGKSFEVAE